MPRRKAEKKWYAVKVFPGQENKVRRQIRRKARIEGLERFVGRCLVPIRKIPAIQNGKRIVRKMKLYPEYVLVECHYNDEVFYLLKSCYGTILPNPESPVPIEKKEIRALLYELLMDKLDEAEQDQKEPVQKVPYRVGEKVEVVDGMFKGAIGEVLAISNDKEPIVTIPFIVFGRVTNVKLKWWQAERLDASEGK
jgi:transcription termination/antitermination protein NusG